MFVVILRIDCDFLVYINFLYIELVRLQFWFIDLQNEWKKKEN